MKKVFGDMNLKNFSSNVSFSDNFILSKLNLNWGERGE